MTSSLRSPLLLVLACLLLLSLAVDASPRQRPRTRLRLLPDDFVVPLEEAKAERDSSDPSAASLARWKAAQLRPRRPGALLEPVQLEPLKWDYGLNNYTLQRPEGLRSYNLYVPRSYRHSPVSVVLALHGLGDNVQRFGSRTNITALSEERGFLALWPQGSAGLLGAGWNGGTCCVDQSVDDVGFLHTLIQLANVTFAVRQESIHVFGFSNGGFMTERLGCELSRVFRSIASVAGNTILVHGGPQALLACDVAYSAGDAPLSGVLHVHGTADDVVHFEGDPLMGWGSIAADMDAWAARNKCPVPPRQTWNTSTHYNLLWSDCGEQGKTQVELVVQPGGVHSFVMQPGGFLTSNYILDFFDRATPGGL